MLEKLSLRRLASNENRPEFDCGDDDLNEFFSVDSRISSDQLLSVTYIAEIGAEVVAFFRVAFGVGVKTNQVTP